MIFEAEPQQIEALDSKELVRLLKLLLLAESRLADIPLRATHEPFQITVADGGEDGRVEWTDGADSTPYFPRRFCIFQAKATQLTEASVLFQAKATQLTEASVRSEILKRAPADKKKKTARRSKAKNKSLAKIPRRNFCFE